MGHENAWRTYETIREWIIFSDQKALAIITANGLIIAALTLLSQPAEYAWWLRCIIALGLGLSIASVVLSILSITPQLDIGESRSLIFFGHIAKRRSSQVTPDNLAREERAFIEEFVGTVTTEGKWTREVASQVWANSEIAWQKHRQVTLASRFFLWGFLTSSLFILLLATGIAN